MKTSSGNAGENRSNKMTPTTTRDSPDTPSTTSTTKLNKYGYREVTRWHELGESRYQNRSTVQNDRRRDNSYWDNPSPRYSHTRMPEDETELSEEEIADIKKAIEQTKEFNLQRFKEIDDAQAEELRRRRLSDDD